MTCMCPLKSGPRTGQRCNAKVAPGHRFCGRHAGCAAAARPVKGGVKPVKGGVKPVKGWGGMKRLYNTHWNGGYIFKVQDYGGYVDIFDFQTGKKLFTLDYQKLYTAGPKVHYGSREWGVQEGTSLLLKRAKGAYVFISDAVHTFWTLGQEEVTFFPVIGPNDVPYAYAIGQRYTYLLNDGTYVPNTDLPLSVLKLESHPQEFDTHYPNQRRLLMEAVGK
jgi:hypothetical protein